MPRIAGVDIPAKKRVEIALTYIFGIGPMLAKRVLKEANIDVNVRADDLSENEVARIREIIDAHFKVEGDLRRDIMSNIKRLKDLGTYRGLRHIRNLPCRGQRSHTNARTRKGKKKMAVKSRGKAVAQK